MVSRLKSIRLGATSYKPTKTSENKKNKAYKPTRTSENKKKLPYKSYRTYKPISIEPRSPQPGGPEGAGGYIYIYIFIYTHIYRTVKRCGHTSEPKKKLSLETYKNFRD